MCTVNKPIAFRYGDILMTFNGTPYILTNCADFDTEKKKSCVLMQKEPGSPVEAAYTEDVTDCVLSGERPGWGLVNLLLDFRNQAQQAVGTVVCVHVHFCSVCVSSVWREGGWGGGSGGLAELLNLVEEEVTWFVMAIKETV